MFIYLNTVQNIVKIFEFIFNYLMNIFYLFFNLLFCFQIIMYIMSIGINIEFKLQNCLLLSPAGGWHPPRQIALAGCLSPASTHPRGGRELPRLRGGAVPGGGPGAQRHPAGPRRWRSPLPGEVTLRRPKKVGCFLSEEKKKPSRHCTRRTLGANPKSDK